MNLTNIDFQDNFDQKQGDQKIIFKSYIIAEFFNIQSNKWIVLNNFSFFKNEGGSVFGTFIMNSWLVISQLQFYSCRALNSYFISFTFNNFVLLTNLNFSSNHASIKFNFLNLNFFFFRNEHTRTLFK